MPGASRADGPLVLFFRKGHHSLPFGVNPAVSTENGMRGFAFAGSEEDDAEQQGSGTHQGCEDLCQREVHSSSA